MKRFRAEITGDDKLIFVSGPKNFPVLLIDCDDVTEGEDKALQKEVKKLLRILEEHWEP